VFPFHRRLRIEPLEDRRLLSAASADTAIQLFSTSTALFVENQGQWQDESVRYAFNGPGVNIGFTDEGLKFVLTQSEAVEEQGLEEGDSPIFPRGTTAGGARKIGTAPDASIPDGSEYITQTAQFSVSFDGANAVTPIGLDEAPTRFNYFVGHQANWRAGVPGFATVAYENLYDGIDLHTFGRRDSLKYEFDVAPGADWRQIQVSYDGVEGLWIDEAGALHVQTELGELVDDAPYIYQVIDDQEVEVAGSFVVLDADTYAFEVTGPYDSAFTLVIDPDLGWSTYLGGISGDAGYGVAVDGSGAVVVTGETVSPGWVSGGFDTSHNSDVDAFVVKLSASGAHVWSTYLGGSNWDWGYDVAVDGSGAVIVTGETLSSGWVSGGFDTSHNGGYDALVAKLSASGAHLWSTYLGGGSEDYGRGVAVDGSGTVVVTGATNSPGWVSGGFDTSHNGYVDAFVARISASGAHLWSTYLGGGSGNDTGNGVAVDGSGAVVVTGYTSSSGWVSGGFDTSYEGYSDAFVAKLSASGAHLWSTYLGGGSGGSEDYGSDVAVDSGGAVLVTGGTNSPDWVSGGFDMSHNGGFDAFVAKISASGAHDWSTYLGGSSYDVAWGVAMVDGSGAVVVTGETESSGWVSDGFDTSYNGGVRDAFVARLSSSGGHLWSTYLGGSDWDGGYGVAMDGSGAEVVSGYTDSSGWVSGGFDTSYDGLEDAFVARIVDVQPPALPGDYNQDGNIDAADYVVWRKTLGTTGVPPYSGADGSGNGTVGPEDHGVWVANFGEMLPGAGSGAVVGQTATALAEPVAVESVVDVPLAVSEKLPHVAAAVRDADADFGLRMDASRGQGAGSGDSLTLALSQREREGALTLALSQEGREFRENALVAWLASRGRGDVVHAETSFESLGGRNGDDGSRDGLLGALDSVFEELLVKSHCWTSQQWHPRANMTVLAN
jgi:hypothetical protein